MEHSETNLMKKRLENFITLLTMEVKSKAEYIQKGSGDILSI